MSDKPKYPAIPDGSGMYEGQSTESLREGNFSPAGTPRGFGENSSTSIFPGTYGPGTPQGTPAGVPLPIFPTIRLYSVRQAPAQITRETVFSDFSIVGTFTCKQPYIRNTFLKAISNFNILPEGIPLSQITINNTGALVYVVWHKPPIAGPQKFPPPYKWRTPNPILLAILTLENDPNCSSSAVGPGGFGYWLGQSNR